MDVIRITDQDQFIKRITAAIREAAKDDAFLSKKEAAALIGVHTNTLDKMVNEGRVKRYKNGRLVRFKKSELLEAFEED